MDGDIAMRKRSHELSAITERVYLRLLCEVAEGTAEGLAAYVIEQGDIASAIIYRPAALFKELKKDPDNISAYYDSVVSYLAVQDPGNPCAGAWEVIRTAGPGYGKILYGLAYALSPNGILMSDRNSVSKSAYSAWSKLSSKGRKSFELDDIDADSKDKKTPDDDSDDCNVHKIGDKDCGGRDPGPLNKAYAAEGWEKSTLDKLKKNHRAFMTVLRGIDVDADTAENEILNAGEEFFGSEYGRQSIENMK